MQKKFMIIDGNSLMHRAYHALPMLTSGNMPTNAVYGFLSMLFKAVGDEQPDYVGVAFDISKKVFRHETYPEYKAQRKPMEEELRVQFPLIKEIIAKMNIPILGKENYEADDIIGSVCNTFRTVDTYILTGDKDSLQLVDEDTFVLLMRKGISDIEKYDTEHFREVYGVEPDQFVDVKGFMGDNSDNIPGVPMVGEKTALKLIKQFGSMEVVYENLDQQKGKLKENLTNFKDQAFLSKDLSRIDTQMVIEQDLEDFSFELADLKRSFEMLEEYNMKSLIGRVGKIENDPQPVFEEKHPSVVFAKLEQINTITQLEQILQTAKDEQVAIYINGSRFYFYLAEHNYYLDFPDGLLVEGLGENEVANAFKEVLASNPIISHDSKELIRYFNGFNIEIKNIIFDVTLAAYLIDANEKDYTLAHLTQKHLGVEDINAQGLVFLKHTLNELLGNSEAVYYNMELPLARVLFDMEEVGFKLNVSILEEVGKEYRARIEVISKHIFELANQEFNIASPKQLGVVLFEDMGLPSGKKTKTGYSTGVDVLEQIDHPIIPYILEFRKLSKLVSTYIDGFIPLVDKNSRVHTRFLQTGAATGRISSKEPNLQNIPIRSEEGREIRKAFEAKEGFTLVSGDYSQIDLRVFAHITGDPVMMDAFNKGQDIHARTASEIFHVPIEEVTSSQRRQAKAVNFGIIYGLSPFGLSTNLGIPYAEAKEFIDIYLEKYTGVREYKTEIVEDAKINGFVETLLGRRRSIPQIFSKNRNIAAAGERIALNTPIQGTSADMIKLAMIDVFNQLKGKESRLILQIHDELLIEAKNEEVEEVKVLLKERMSKVMKLNVPVLVDVSSGINWDDTK